jgi:dihydrofolate reductase
MQIHLIWAQDRNGGIGKEGKLPWHIPQDLSNFKKLTLNSTIVMGRITWASLPIKPLPKRRNVVLCSDSIANVESYNSVEQCIETLYKDDVKKIFVIGGAQIYKHFIHRSDELHITLIDEETKGIDTYFPVSLLTIKNKFNKVDEFALRNNALYTHWVKNDLADSC